MSAEALSQWFFTDNVEEADEVIDNDSIVESQDFDDSRTSSSYCSSSFWQEPMVVGYAFGPKKMSTMSVVMAEASRAQVIHEEDDDVDDDDDDDDDDLFHDTNETVMRDDCQTIHRDPIEKSSSIPPPVSTIQTTNLQCLTSEALEGHEKRNDHNDSRSNNNNNNTSNNKHSAVIHFGSSSTNNSSNLKSIVRHFRSSCSSTAASLSETTASTPTTASATTLTRRSPSKFPIRISFVPLDPDFPLEEQHGGNFDLILHKLTEDILSCSLGTSDAAARVRVERLNDYQIQNPSCSLVDDPSSVMTLMSRSAISRRLQKCLKNLTTASGIPVKAPKFIVVNKEDTSTVRRQLTEEGMAVPLIVKPLIAAGTKQSHHMTIVIQDTDSAMMKIPQKSLVQQYVNHDSTLYKVYVMGKHFHVYKRASLPNLPSKIAEVSTKDLLEFDSQHPYPRLKDFGVKDCEVDNDESDNNNEQQHQQQLQQPPLVSPEEVRPIVDALKQAFGLELFGFDILISAERQQQEWLVVDVNYFPSYKEVPNFPTQLAHYLTQRVLQQRRQNLENNESLCTR